MVKSVYIIAPLAITLAIALATLGYLYLTLPCFWRECLPDLLVEDYTTEWVDRYTVHVTVKNDGCKKSPMCWVYCRAISTYPPVGQSEVRVSISYLMEELPPGETATHSFSFDAKVLWNENVDVIIIIVDGTYYVEESNEENNFEYLIWPSE